MLSFSFIVSLEKNHFFFMWSDPERLTPRGYSQYLLQGQYLKNHSFFCPYLLKLTMINIQGLLHMQVRQSLSNG